MRNIVQARESDMVLSIRNWRMVRISNFLNPSSALTKSSAIDGLMHLSKNVFCSQRKSVEVNVIICEIID